MHFRPRAKKVKDVFVLSVRTSGSIPMEEESAEPCAAATPVPRKKSSKLKTKNSPKKKQAPKRKKSPKKKKSPKRTKKK